MTGPGGRSGRHSPGDSPVTGPGGRSGKHSPGGRTVTGRLRRRAGASAALALAFLVAGPASPAFAEPVIVRPAANATVDTSTVTVSGNAKAETPLGLPLGALDTVTLTIGEETITARGCSEKPSCDFAETFRLPFNGRYTVEVVAKSSGLLPGEASKSSRSFAVAAPAAKPVLDPPKVTAGRAVDLSWSRNTEPDMLYYAVTRTDPAGAKSAEVKVTQPDKGSKVTLTDTTTAAATAGGTYAYQVQAVRKGATAGSEIRSVVSAAASAVVPLAPTTTSTTGANVPGSPAGGPTTTVRPGAPAGVDLSGFLSSRSQPIPLPKITVPEPPDTGFSGSLPFGVGPAGEELEEGDAEAVPPTDRLSTSAISIDAARPLVPVAGGLVLLLLAMHMRLLGRRVKNPPDGDLHVDVAHEPPGPPAPPAPAPDPVAAPEKQTVLYDVAADPEDDEEEWAAAAFEIEPEQPPEEEPEPEVATLWAPPVVDEEEPPPTEPDPEEIEVFEVVSSSRRRLVRTGDR